MIQAQLHYRFLLPKFQQAISNKSITAWICANDHIALLALRFLATRKNKETVSLVGFDDTPEALENDVTSFNFNVESSVNAILMAFVNRKISCSPEERHMEIEGMIVERGSTNNKNRLS